MKAQKANGQINGTFARKPNPGTSHGVDIHFDADSHRLGHVVSELGMPADWNNFKKWPLF